jgi:hypothetical protein
MLSQLPELDADGETAETILAGITCVVRHETHPSSTTRSPQTRRPCPRGRRSICHPQSTYLLHQRRVLHVIVDSQLAVHVKRLVCLDFHLSDTVAGRHAFVYGGLEFVTPRAAPAVAIAVVVAAQKVALRLAALLDRERYVDGLEQVLFERGVEGDDVVDVVLDVLGVEPPQQVAGGLAGEELARGIDVQGAVYWVGHGVRGFRAGGRGAGVVADLLSAALDAVWCGRPVARVMQLPHVAHLRVASTSTSPFAGEGIVGSRGWRLV